MSNNFTGGMNNKIKNFLNSGHPFDLIDYFIIGTASANTIRSTSHTAVKYDLLKNRNQKRFQAKPAAKLGRKAKDLNKKLQI